MMHPDDLVPIQPSASIKDDKYKSSDNSPKTVTVRPAAEPQRCPRCDSSNTKFCYYNNYNLSQPRYFCKTCRRYWTKGGALRNIPVGGGSRKNKKIYSKSSSSSSRFSSDFLDLSGSSSYLDHVGGYKFSSTGLSSGINLNTIGNNFPKIISPIQQYQQSSITPFGNISRSLPSTSCPGLHNIPSSSSVTFTGFNSLQDEDHNTRNNDIVASSIESLSSINQDLHWKLQQERLGMMTFDEGNNFRNTSKVASSIIYQEMINPQRAQLIRFENLEIPARAIDEEDVQQSIGELIKDNNNGRVNESIATDWLFEHNSNHSHVQNQSARTNINNTTISGGINEAWCNFNTPLP